jgi:hypothetical protein
MFKLIVIGKNGREAGEFATQAEAQAHFDHHRTKGHWGKEEQIIEHEEIPAVYETIIHPAEPALIDENGVEVVPAKAEWSEQVLISEAIPAWTEVIPAEFTYEIQDKTAEVKAEKTKQDNKKSDRFSRVDQFKKIDWNAIDTIAELKVIVRSLVKEAIKDDE